jgi:hypothetical protein
MTRGVKPILGLIVLLTWPCLGLGSRAEASFALGRSHLTSGRSAGASGFELQLVLNGEETESKASPSSLGMGKESTPFAPSEPSRAPFPPRNLLPRFIDLLTAGESSTGTSSTGPSSGPGLPFILPSGLLGPGVDQSGILLLADERVSPPSSASRLFRPPR